MNYVANITPEHNSVVLNLKELFNITDECTVDLEYDFKNSDVYLNSVKCTDECKNTTITVSPYIVTIRVHYNSSNYDTGQIKLTVNGGNEMIIYVDDYDVQKLQDTDKEATLINSKLDTFMLLRTNPKLTGNIKLVVDSNYHLYLDTFKVSSTLNHRIYRKYPISSKGNYPSDVMTVFSKLPQSELFKLPSDSLNPHKYFDDYSKQYITYYEYGALTNDDNLYSENMKILAPIHIGKHIPDFFVIFRNNSLFNVDTYKATDTDDTTKFKSLLQESDIVKIFDLRTYTTIGQYLNNYASSIKDYLYGSCYMLFIEQDNDKWSSNYRQGNNSWKGIDVTKGIITNKIETSYFANNILEKSDSVQEQFNDYIINGYERNNVLYPYILNLEFMFNDEDSEEFSMHKYFGLYMSANEILNYDCIISDNEKNNQVTKKLDINDNIVDDENIIKNMFVEEYKDRMFFMTTNNDSARVQSSEDILHFISEYVLDNPDKLVCSMKVDKVEWHDNEQSFITMTFDEPIHYGEHLRFIALNIQNQNTGEYENICLELIASNDLRLRFTDNNISPYISTNTPELHNCSQSNDSILNNIYRLSFYTQSLTNATVSATLKEQFERIKNCIYRFNSFINYENANSDTISFTSSYDNVYFQHISPVNKFDEPDYEELYITISDNEKYLHYTDLNLNNKDYSYINTLKNKLGTKINDKTIQCGYNANDSFYTKDNVQKVTTYVNYEDNILKDTIHYFTKSDESFMYPLSPDSYYFSNLYGVFSLYGYEMLGWRYNSIVKFKNISDFENTYIIYDDIESILKNVKHPIVKTTTGQFETILKIITSEGYITDNNIIKLNIENFDEHTQEIILFESENNILLNPYNVDKNIINLYNPADVHNCQINIFNPESASINVMGIYNVKDIDMSINYDLTETLSSNDAFMIPLGTIININGDSDALISKGVAYRIFKGGFNEFAALDFVIVGDTLYTRNGSNETVTSTSFSRGFLTVSSDLYIKAFNGGKEQIYDFTQNIPNQSVDNFYKDKSSKLTSNLYIPVVPLTNCLWESNGLYFDGNSVLNTDELKNTYTQKGYFTEHFFGPSIELGDNKFIKNSVDSFASINDNIDSFRNLIINNSIKNPIKKLLIQSNKIDTAVGYYNTYVQSLEFIYYGIKFSIKFNSDYYTQNLRISEYNNFEVYIINDYNPQKNNEIYISVDEEIILIINHKYDIHNLNKSYNQLFDLTKDKFISKYSVYPAPYSLYTNSLCGTSYGFMGAKTISNYVSINENATDVFFVQDDRVIDNYEGDDNILPNYFYFNFNKNAADKKDDVIVKSDDDYKIGCLLKNGDEYLTVEYPYNLNYEDLWSLNYHTYNSYILSVIDDSNIDNTDILSKYIDSFNNNHDCYIINNYVCESILISDVYKPININLSIPNKIKYNFGYFTPRFYNIIDFKPNDYNLLSSLNINLLLSNTVVSKVNTIKTYTGNKIFSLNNTISTNYFMMNDKSVLSSNWDNNYYRKYDYDNQDSFTYIAGYVPGIEDKSLFGSHCITFLNNHITLNDFSDKHSVKQDIKKVASNNNIYSKNRHQYTFTINITLSVYSLFQNNTTFINNWTGLTSDIDISMKNYIKNTISKIYNIQRNIEITLYKKSDSNVQTMSLYTENINDYTNWTLIDGFETEFSVDNNDLLLTVTMNENLNCLIHPQIKISRI